jgi:hypothetical protein
MIIIQENTSRKCLVEDIKHVEINSLKYAYKHPEE